MIGHQEIEKSFLKLVKDDNLSHGYLFFGEPQVGKFLFARSFANLLERGNFKVADGTLSEFLIVKPEVKESGERSTGIEAIRGLKSFLFEKPVNSKYRLAVIDDAQFMTDQAQNAILKIAEEPPEHAVLIIIAANPDVLLKTVQSRFQRIYFPRVSRKDIKDMLVKDFKTKANEAEDLAALSFGRPGRAVDLLQNETLKEIASQAKNFAKGKLVLKNIMAELADIENRDRIEPFLTELIAELSLDVRKNSKALESLIYRHQMLNEWNTNKRIQLEAGLGPISRNF